jgi:hypothetical protein
MSNNEDDLGARMNALLSRFLSSTLIWFKYIGLLHEPGS